MQSGGVKELPLCRRGQIISSLKKYHGHSSPCKAEDRDGFGDSVGGTLFLESALRHCACLGLVEQLDLSLVLVLAGYVH